jgi:hypothetical protein
MAASALVLRSSKFPPVVAAIVVEILLPPELEGVVTLTVPVDWPTGIVICAPLERVTTTSLPATGEVRLAVYVIAVPSATAAVAVRLTVVVSVTSVIVVVAAVALANSCSKFPPVAEAIVADTFTGLPWYTSFGAATVVEPLEAPPAIVIVAPLLKVTVTG